MVECAKCGKVSTGNKLPPDWVLRKYTSHSGLECVEYVCQDCVYSKLLKHVCRLEDIKMGLELKPCPRCARTSGLILFESMGGELTIGCRHDGYSMRLECTLPVSPEEVINEWNGKVSE